MYEHHYIKVLLTLSRDRLRQYSVVYYLDIKNTSMIFRIPPRVCRIMSANLMLFVTGWTQVYLCYHRGSVGIIRSIKVYVFTICCTCSLVTIPASLVTIHYRCLIIISQYFVSLSSHLQVFDLFDLTCTFACRTSHWCATVNTRAPLPHHVSAAACIFHSA